MKNSKIIICTNIYLDKKYNNCLTYSEADMVSLCESKALRSASNYSFIKVGENKINVAFAYSDAIKCNYMAFQNPYYSNKWFFAFIDEVEYINDGNVTIHYTIDEFATWYSYWNPKACFVVREHVNDDTFGLHTIPEGLETGEYISTKLQPEIHGYDTFCFVVATTEQVLTGYSTLNETLPTGLYYTGLTTLQGVKDLVATIQNDEIINSIFVAPKDFFSSWGSSTGINGQVSNSVRFSLNNVNIDITRVGYLGNDYVPKNNKLLCFPYSFLQVSNHSGTIVNYNWEDFNLLLHGSNYRFILGCAFSPGCSGVAYPSDYKNILNNVDEGIAYGKFPVGGWNSDTYTNWLTQNGVNVGIGVVGGALASGVGIASAVATGGLSLALTGAVIGGLTSIGSSIASIYTHSLAPDQSKGNVNIGDYTYAYNNLNLEFKRISIKNEYAKIIDDYFNRQGYKVNEIKIPNQLGRAYWNYVQIGASESIGYSTTSGISVPMKSMDIINDIYRRGVTLWHSHENIGNYSLNNSIV